MDVIPLSDLKPGESGIVDVFEGDTDAHHRLREMGVLEGTLIKLVRVAPFGDPLELAIRGYRLSLRRKDAAQIFIRKQG